MSETIDTPMDTSDQDQINDDDMVQQLEQRWKDFADFVEAEMQRLRSGSKVIEKGGGGGEPYTERGCRGREWNNGTCQLR